MMKKIQSAICLLMIGGFIVLSVFCKKDGVAVMTSGGNLDTVPDRQVIVLDAGHGGSVLTTTFFTETTASH